MWQRSAADARRGTPALPGMDQVLGPMQSLCRLTVLQLMSSSSSFSHRPPEPSAQELLQTAAELRALTQLTRLEVQHKGLRRLLIDGMPRCLVASAGGWRRGSPCPSSL
jgi:hypothetical protein